MHKLKQYIINFYKTHDSTVSLNFYKVMRDLEFTKIDLDGMLRSLIHDGFIISTQDADGVAYLFRINQ